MQPKIFAPKISASLKTKRNFRRKMGQARLTVLFLAVLIGVALACVPPDCDTPDCGSCGK